MITRIAHVCVVVKDLPLALDFYRKVFGFEQKFPFLKDGQLRGAYLEVGPMNYIEFFDGRNNEVVNNGITHFCLETENMDRFIEHLAQIGVAHTPKKLGSDQSYQIWITDPDGNRIEIHEYTKESSQLTGAEALINW